MRIAQPPALTQETVAIPMQTGWDMATDVVSDILNFAAFFPFCAPPKPNPVSSMVRFPGLVTFSNCVIEFDDKQELSVKIPEIHFAGATYVGVIPLEEVAPLRYECCVDHIRIS